MFDLVPSGTRAGVRFGPLRDPSGCSIWSPPGPERVFDLVPSGTRAAVRFGPSGTRAGVRLVPPGLKAGSRNLPQYLTFEFYCAVRRQ